MQIPKLRKVGGSVMLAVPPAARRHLLEELLAASDYDAPQAPEDREWVDAPPAGRELI